MLAAAPAEAKIHHAIRQKRLNANDPGGIVAAALAQDIITPEDADLLARADEARLAAIAVDDFSPEELTGGH